MQFRATSEPREVIRAGAGFFATKLLKTLNARELQPRFCETDVMRGFFIVKSFLNF